MGKASRRKRERQSAVKESEVSSRRSSRIEVSVTVEKTFLSTHPKEDGARAISSGKSKLRSTNWGGRRTNQTGRPKLYDSDEERLAAAAARRRAARVAVKKPLPKPRGRPTKEETESSWGGARNGAGRPPNYQTVEERRARNSELSRLSSERRRARQEAAFLVDGFLQDRQRFAIRARVVESPREPTCNTSMPDVCNK